MILFDFYFICRLLMEELQLETRAQVRRNDNRKHYERNLLVEVERLQRDIEVAKQSTELHHLTADGLKKEVSFAPKILQVALFKCFNVKL